jgi:hypothetical protein
VVQIPYGVLGSTMAEKCGSLHVANGGHDTSCLTGRYPCSVFIVERSNNANPTQILSILFVIPLFVSIWKFIYTDGVDVLVKGLNAFAWTWILPSVEERGAPSLRTSRCPESRLPSRDRMDKDKYPRHDNGYFSRSTRSYRTSRQTPGPTRFTGCTKRTGFGGDVADKYFYFFVFHRPLSYLPSLRHCSSLR